MSAARCGSSSAAVTVAASPTAKQATRRASRDSQAAAGSLDLSVSSSTSSNSSGLMGLPISEIVSSSPS